MKNIKKGLQQWIRQSSMSKFQWFVLLAGLGVAIMIFTSFLSVQNEIGSSVAPDSSRETAEEALIKDRKAGPMDQYEEEYESELKEILETVIGVNDVSVMVNLDSTEETVVEKDLRVREQETEERDPENATRSVTENDREETVVVIEDGDGQSPIVRKRLKPNVRGVLIVAEGADDLQVKAWILEAIQRVLEVPAHQISVLPRKS